MEVPIGEVGLCPLMAIVVLGNAAMQWGHWRQCEKHFFLFTVAPAGDATRGAPRSMLRQGAPAGLVDIGRSVQGSA